jgi:signal transduction histidine kinase/CheY-like chemotaxis protein
MAAHSATPPRRTRRRRPMIVGLGNGLVVAAITALIGGTALYGIRRVLFEDVREYLRATVETAALLIDGDQHLTFTRPEQESTAAYLTAARQLQAFVTGNSSIPFAYTGIVTDDSIRFVIEARSRRKTAVTGVAENSMRGQVTWAPPPMRAMWNDGKTVVDESQSTSPWGPSLKATAIIHTHDGKPAGFVGVTLSLDRYRGWVTRLDNVVFFGIATGLLLSIISGFAAYRLERSRLVAEGEMLGAKAAAEASSRAKGEFLANMSHEIRTPLHGVLGMSEAMLASAHTEADRRSLEVINKSAASLLGILNDILDYSKLEAGRVELVNAPFDPRALIDDVTDLFAVKADVKGLEIVVREAIRSDRLPVGDSARMKQVVLNLVGNAVKFTESGHVIVDLETVMIGRNTVALRIRVTDTGIGIAPELQSRLFEQFEQGEANAARRFGGTGLGLAISRQLTILMGGSLTVDSTLGVGTSFTVDVQLPVSTDAREIVTLDRLPPGSRALICSEYPLTRDAIVEMLGRFGIASDACTTGAAMLERVKSGTAFAFVLAEPPDELFRSEPMFAGIPKAPPLVLLTSLHQPLNNSQLSDLGAIGQLRRPVREDHMGALLAELAVIRRGVKLTPTVAAEPVPVSATVLPAKPESAAAGLPRVLVVDDVDLNLMVARAMLGSLGTSVVSANGGGAALKLIDGEKFALILMDCHMPEIDGYEVTRRARTGQSPNRDTPIVALSASAFAEDRQRALDSGMNDFAPKPIELNGLGLVLEKWIPGFVAAKLKATKIIG